MYWFVDNRWYDKELEEKYKCIFTTTVSSSQCLDRVTWTEGCMDYHLMFQMYCQDGQIKTMVEHGQKVKTWHFMLP